MENLEKSDDMNGGNVQEELGDAGGKIEAVGEVVLSAVEVYDSLNGNVKDGTCEMVEVGVVFDKDVASPVELGDGDDGVKEGLGNEEEDMHETVENSIVAREEQGREGENEVEEEKRVENQDYKFSVGEFVWAKTLDRPWWPGQIYDPANASKAVAMYNRKNRVLVVFFGKETSAWCCPSQVRPFQEIFDKISMLGNTSSFYTAVEEALCRIGRCIEWEMSCHCVSVETRTRLAMPLALNLGIKQGVAEPEGKIAGLSASEFEPAKFLARLQNFAEAACETSLFERTVFQSQVTAFNYSNGWYQPHIYLELQENSDCMAGDGWETTENLNVNRPAGESSLRPSKADRVSSKASDDIDRNSSAGKFHQKKHRRVNGPLASKKRKARDFESGVDGGMAEDGSSSSISASSSMQQEKPKLSGSDSACQDSNDNTLQNDDNGAVDGQTGYLPRKRKKSRYLSPPYTMTGTAYKSLMSLKDNVPNSMASQQEESWGLIKRSDRVTRKEQDSTKTKKVEIDLEGCNILDELYTAALEPMYLEKSNNYDKINRFFLHMRSYRYRYGFNCPANRRTVPQCSTADIGMVLPGENVHKVCDSSSLGSPGEILHEVNAKSGDCKKRKGRDWKEDARSRISQNKAAIFPLVSPAQEAHETNCVASEGSSRMIKRKGTEAATFQIPQSNLFAGTAVSPGGYVQKTDVSKSEGGKRKRGRPKKDTTPDSLQIMVETASSIRNKNCNSGAPKSKGYSQYILAPVVGNARIPIPAIPVSFAPPNAGAPPLQVVRQNLEGMTSALEKAGDKLPPDVKASLEIEIKKLLEKVHTMA